MITTHVDDERRRLREGRNAYTPCAADGCERSPHTGHPLFRVNDYKARHKALTEAWQAVDRAVRPLGTDCGQSPWNAGYTQARNEAQNAILELRDRA